MIQIYFGPHNFNDRDTLFGFWGCPQKPGNAVRCFDISVDLQSSRSRIRYGFVPLLRHEFVSIGRSINPLLYTVYTYILQIYIYKEYYKEEEEEMLMK